MFVVSREPIFKTLHPLLLNPLGHLKLLQKVSTPFPGRLDGKKMQYASVVKIFNRIRTAQSSPRTSRTKMNILCRAPPLDLPLSATIHPYEHTQRQHQKEVSAAFYQDEYFSRPPSFKPPVSTTVHPYEHTQRQDQKEVGATFHLCPPHRSSIRLKKKRSVLKTVLFDQHLSIAFSVYFQTSNFDPSPQNGFGSASSRSQFYDFLFKMFKKKANRKM